MKFCRDCTHISYDKPSSGDIQCRRRVSPNYIFNQSPSESVILLHREAQNERMDLAPTACGPDARFFEEKPVAQTI